MSVVPSVVSPTLAARAGMSGEPGRSLRLKTMPVSGAAGLTVINTFLPVCRPTPVARMLLRRVR